MVAQWDPHTHPIITEVAGQIRFIDLVEGVTMNRQTDEVTGLSSIVITAGKQRGLGGKELRPMVKLANGQTDQSSSIANAVGKRTMTLQ